MVNNVQKSLMAQSNVFYSCAKKYKNPLFEMSSVTNSPRTAAHFSKKGDKRTGMQKATLGKSGSEAAPKSQGRIARAFFSNSLVNAMEMTAASRYILTAAQSLGSQD